MTPLFIECFALKKEIVKKHQIHKSNIIHDKKMIGRPNQLFNKKRFNFILSYTFGSRGVKGFFLSAIKILPPSQKRISAHGA